ncbi:electron transfer flavoprotein subunit beta/FixA family protein [Lentilactobacillus senioris]|uniref:electron transfer flavoprotein subunit beta/FixA family protein n=1 Tax=Lentilactobacillus senioris TaxID=931534 RepID=UPI00227ECAC5|nr:electron transfer flavoprotein subunit beta/FixA family protein [Lentilactobacillus senioris]MCY9806193.1 electron transfer flavoprotein subunit beta/FixA family protein [Lentilactobacillus senioris]
MKIIVCIKQVPNTDSVKLDPKTNNLVRSGVDGIINPYDKNAIETALRLKEQAGGEVILLSMGPDSYASSLREGLAMGADSAVLLSSRALGGADTLATGYSLAQAIQKIGAVDLILFGRQSIDADTGQVGPIVAEELNLPQVTFADKVELLENNIITGSRQLDNATQKIRVSLPAAVTVGADINQPRYATPVNIMQSFVKPLTTWSEKDLSLNPAQIGQAGSPTQVTKVYAPEVSAKQTTILAKDPAEAVNELLSDLDY